MPRNSPDLTWKKTAYILGFLALAAVSGCLCGIGALTTPRR